MANQLEFDPDILFSDEPVKKRKELLTNLRALAQTPGWAYIVKVLRDQAERRFVAVGRFQPRTVEEVLDQAVLRGEALNMEVLTELPDILIGMFELDLKQAGVTEDEDEDDEYS